MTTMTSGRPEFAREDLIALCRDGLLPEEKWRNRDSAPAQIQLGIAQTLLSAGCTFSVAEKSDSETLRVQIVYRGFSWFDHQGRLDEETFYVPTRQRLVKCAGSDWY